MPGHQKLRNIKINAFMVIVLADLLAVVFLIVTRTHTTKYYAISISLNSLLLKLILYQDFFVLCTKSISLMNSNHFL